MSYRATFFFALARFFSCFSSAKVPSVRHLVSAPVSASSLPRRTCRKSYCKAVPRVSVKSEIHSWSIYPKKMDFTCHIISPTAQETTSSIPCFFQCESGCGKYTRMDKSTLLQGVFTVFTKRL